MRSTNSIRWRRTGIALLAAAGLTALPVADGQGTAGGSGAVAAEHPADAGAADRNAGAWRGAWAASPQAPAAPFGPNWSTRGFSDHTVRQVVRVSTGGTRARIELSNRYGTTPLRITGATVARTAEGGAVRPGSLRQLSFGKGRSVTIPAGGTALSDGVPFTVRALESVTVTLYLAEETGPATFHHFAGATSYRAGGDHRADVGGSAFTETSTSWYYLSGVEITGVRTARRDGVVTFGDSITDGVGGTNDVNNRYPDELAERFAAAGKPRSVLNHGIGGNQVTNDTTWAGEKGIARFKKDVLTEPGVRTVIVLEGINDIGGNSWTDGPTPEVSVEQLIEGHRSLIRQAHAKGIKVVGATLTPIKGSFYGTPENEAKRDAFNHWIRTSGEYDAVVDFDRAVADPADPDRILPAYDSGDHLHPGDAGYRAMAEALELDEL
ncbi:SGNH/GDSL hydrolase family protein [Streptomyces sp. PKU-EA00015]|uniref:SGNH/GDSL hydrolase family protein n=1 Tax=Streptomyces sp. PKU-EA00015 TaxID=2748326 RepID=UPI0015A42710|nr:SGNH/GDSL hydrolase family protein [Streptomyces sp. PKU-EA00015]NWF29922.1 SGNH/GDSL hydrolase family protein [Streptomyces sp. PKU-EA00015]